MTRYSFTVQEDTKVEGYPDNIKTTISFDAYSLPQIFEAMRTFLLAAGFSPISIEKYLDT